MQELPTIIWVETLNLWWKQSTKHHSITLQTWSEQFGTEIHKCFLVFLTTFCITKIVKWDFFGKIDDISQLQYA